MHSLVTGMVWCAHEADGLSEDPWSFGTGNTSPSHWLGRSSFLMDIMMGLDHIPYLVTVVYCRDTPVVTTALPASRVGSGGSSTTPS